MNTSSKTASTRELSNRKRSHEDAADASDQTKKQAKKASIYWTLEKEEHLLRLFKEQLSKLGDDKSIKNANWKPLADCMTSRFTGDEFTAEKCRAKYSQLRKDYCSFKLVSNASGIEQENDESVWNDLYVKDPNTAKFKDGTPFAHYKMMHETIGENIFQGKNMTSAAVFSETSVPISLLDNEGNNFEKENEFEGDKGESKVVTNSNSTSHSTSLPTNSNSTSNRGTKNSTHLQSAKIMGSYVQEFGKNIQTSISSLVHVLKGSDEKIDNKPDYHDQAISYFKPNGSLYGMMTEKEARKKIVAYFRDEKNCRAFLDYPENFKEEFVDDEILDLHA